MDDPKRPPTLWDVYKLAADGPGLGVARRLANSPQPETPAELAARAQQNAAVRQALSYTTPGVADLIANPWSAMVNAANVDHLNNVFADPTKSAVQDVADQTAAEQLAQQPPPVVPPESPAGMALAAEEARGIEQVSAQRVTADRSRIDSQLANMQAGVRQQQAGIQAQVGAQQQAARQQQAAYDEQAVFLARQARVERDASLATQQRMDGLHKSIEAITQQVADPGQIDQNRLWNNMSTGGKILAGISMLFGAVGAAQTGVNSAVKVFQDAIKQDLDVQAKNVANRRDALRSQLEGYGRLADMVRQSGLDERAARVAEIQLKTNAVVAQINAYAAQLGGAEAQAKAQMAGGAVQTEAAKAMAGLEQEIYGKEVAVAEGNADRDLRAQMHNQSTAASMAEARLKAEKGAPPRLIRDAQAAELEGLMTAMDATQTLLQKRTALGTGYFSAIANKAKGTELGAAVFGPEVRDYEQAAQAFITVVGKKVDESVLQNHDVLRWNKLVSSSSYRSEQGLLELAKLSVKAYNNRLAAFAYAGYAVQDYPAAAIDKSGAVVYLPPGTPPPTTVDFSKGKAAAYVARLRAARGQ